MNTLNSQTLYGALAVRYDTGFSQDIADQVQALARRDIQLLDIKDLNDLAAEYRARIRELIIACRSTEEKTTVRQVYASFEQIFIRRQITDLWKLYRIICADCHEMTSIYMDKLEKGHQRASSHHTEKEYRAAA